MAEEKKLGPNVTYVGQGEGDKTAATIEGVRMVPGESVNLEDRLGKEKAKEVLKKLSANQFFKVDGGPDHAAEAKKRAEAEAKAAEAQAKDEQKQREEAAKAQGQSTEQSTGGSPMERNRPTPPPPEGWEGPEEETLEKPTSRKR